jgi:SAM-dependent methyltransferase
MQNAKGETEKAARKPRRGAGPARVPSRLSAGQMAADFGVKSAIAAEAVATLAGLVRDAAGNAPKCMERWQSHLELVAPAVFQRASEKALLLAHWLGIPDRGISFPELLFALHSYYALVVVLLTDRVLPRDSSQTSSEPCPDGNRWTPRESVWARQLATGVLDWHADLSDASIDRLRQSIIAQLGRYDPRGPGAGRTAGVDLFKQLYQDLIPRALRHDLGEYYTPTWLVEQMLDEVGYRGQPGQRLLDPACGSGAFLVAAITRIRRRQPRDAVAPLQMAAELAREIVAAVVGFDLNPLAVLTARANYLIALGDLAPCSARAGFEIPVHLCDAILDGPAPDRDGPEAFDYVVGNPPWIAWDHLPAAYREATKPLWEKYGLFSLSGNQARHGGGKKDLSMLMAYVSADRYLKPQGRLAFVITQTVFQTRGAGDGFRRFRLGAEGAWLKVIGVNDLVALRPFAPAANWTSTLMLEKGAPTVYPVRYVKWTRDQATGARGPGAGSTDEGHARRVYDARPIEPNQPTSPWLLLPEGWKTGVADLVGPSDYQAHLGANSGGANGVYWLTLLEQCAEGVRVRNDVDPGKHASAVVEQVIEPGLLYPLLRWGDIERWRARPSAHLLLTQDPQSRQGISFQRMQCDYPRTLAYLEQFRPLLIARAAYRRYQAGTPFYSMYNVGPYTLAPQKVLWRRMDRRIRAAVVGEADHPWLGRRALIPQETGVLVAAGSPSEAHYLCGLLNSAVAGFLVRSHSVCGGKSFGTPGMLDFLHLRRFDPADPRHCELSACSRQAHQAVDCPQEVAALEQCIDHLAAEIWGLPRSDLDAIQGERTKDD